MARYSEDYGRYGRGTPRRSGSYDAGYGGGYRGRESYGAEGGYGDAFGGRDADWGWEGQGGGYGTGRGGYERDFGGGSSFGDQGVWSARPGQQQGRQGSREQVRAAEIMTENPETVTPEATLADVARKMRDLDVGIIPVVDSTESRRLRGVITDRDITVRAVAEGKDATSTTVADCMTSGVQTVNKNDPVDRVLDLMQREQVRRVPVTDREGRLVGIIAQADVATDFADEGQSRQRAFAETMERISEPGEPQRGWRR